MGKQKKAPSKASGSTARNVSAAKTPRRREIAAVVFFILGIFSFIGYFNSDGAFIGFFCGLIKGLIGPGFFTLPPALVLCAVILIFHRGRPVCFRVTCTLLLTVVIGALIHLFACKIEYTLSVAMLSSLWKDGRTLVSGGMISGSLSEVFHYLFSKAGAAIVFICSCVFLLLSALNKTIVGIVDAYRHRERPQYIPEPAPEPQPRREPAKVPPPKKRKKIIDIPIDGEERPAVPLDFPQPADNHFNSTPRVKTPDQAVAAYTDGDTESAPEQNPDADVPLDIPFMEKRTTQRDKTETDTPTEQETPAAHEQQPVPERIPEQTPERAQARTKNREEPWIPEIIKTDGSQVYSFPPIDLLTAGSAATRVDGSEEVRMNSERLEMAFRSFGVSVKITGATRGPSVTRYEAELEAGIKLNKLTSLADDIALSLGTSGVRIAAMPNKISTVGIEVPNKLISKVYLRDIIETPEFTRAQSKLTFAIGKDISGEAIVGNISKLPHMLVAGTTGSGKSVCLNSLILSILYKAAPDEVRFIMIDPKMVEFRVYNSIPHLLVPVVTDVKKASGALQWAVVEMMKRYKLFSETNARDLESYNQLARKSEEIDVMPQIVVVIDELADLMMTAAKEVEESICRVAQMGRAAGVHLIIATQSPRADVITGLMKANIPSRIALKVSSALESRIILDAGGNADKLVGNGDMLYAPIGTTKPMRIQGTWVTDEERENVVEFIKASGESNYSEEVINEIDKAAADKGGKDKDEPDSSNDQDEMLPQAADVIFETGQASVSMLQRRLKLGYSRAARIVDQLERIGVVGPFEGSKPRAILITKQQWRQMQYSSGTAPADSHIPGPSEDAG